MVAPGMVAYDNPPLAHMRPATMDYAASREAGIERLADTLAGNPQIERLHGELR